MPYTTDPPKMDRLGGGQVWGRNAPGRDLGTVRHKAQTAPRGFHFCAVFAFSHAVLRAGGAGDADASARAPEMRRTKTCALPSLRKRSTALRSEARASS